MARSFRLEDAMPLLTEIERGHQPLDLPPPKRKLTYFCGRCQRYHYIYSNIGNEHRDDKLT